MFYTSPCADNELCETVVLCNSRMHPTVSCLQWRHIQSNAGSCLCALPSVCRPSTLCCQRMRAEGGGMCCQCLTALVTHSTFHQHCRHVNGGITFRIPQPIMEKWEMGIGVVRDVRPLRTNDITSGKATRWLLATLSVQCDLPSRE